VARRAFALLAAALVWIGLAAWAVHAGRPTVAPRPAPRADAQDPLAFAAPPPRWLAWVGDAIGRAPAPKSAKPAPEALSMPVPPSRKSAGEIDRSASPVLPLPAEPADPELLARAAARLRGGREGAVGPYRFLGEVAPPASWDRLAGALDAEYFERVGLAPLGAPRETVVLFADRARYRAFQIEQPRLAGLRAAGHTASGVVALALDADDAEGSEATFVHELVHLVNRRALGPALPPWLDEGLAEEFAQARIDPQTGRFLWGERRGGVRREGQRLETSGALAGLERLGRALASPAPPTLARLVALDWEAFVADPAELSYPHAHEWVDFLFASDPARAAAFRAYLSGIARGQPAGPETLERALGARLAELEPDFRAAALRGKARAVDAEIAALTVTGERVRTP
jgi:hypothetical protein